MSDLIKRSDVWNITAILHSEFITIEQEQILERIDEMIDGLPSADRPQGEWIETSEGTMCSNCHNYPYDDGEYHIANWHSNYCPNCGCRMRGDKNDQ